MYFNQKGVMFGFDVRVALVIFSILSGAAVFIAYQKIFRAKEAVMIKELQIIDEAVKGLQADVGVFYKFAIATSDGVNDFQALYDSSKLKSGFQRHWGGPYKMIESRDQKTYGDYLITYGQADRSSCTASTDCYAWITLTEVPVKMWNKVNEYTDEDLGGTTEPSSTKHLVGVVQANDTTDTRILYYRSAKRIRN